MSFEIFWKVGGKMYSLQEATHLEFKSIYEVFSIKKYSLDKIIGD